MNSPKRKERSQLLSLFCLFKKKCLFSLTRTLYSRHLHYLKQTNDTLFGPYLFIISSILNSLVSSARRLQVSATKNVVTWNSKLYSSNSPECNISMIQPLHYPILLGLSSTMHDFHHSFTSKSNQTFQISHNSRIKKNPVRDNPRMHKTLAACSVAYRTAWNLPCSLANSYGPIK